MKSCGVCVSGLGGAPPGHKDLSETLLTVHGGSVVAFIICAAPNGKQPNESHRWFLLDGYQVSDNNLGG